MGGLAGAIRGGLAGLNEAAGNPRVAQQLEAQNKAERDNRLQLQIAPLSASLRADMQRLTNYVDANGNPLPQHKADYDLVHDRMANTIGQIRALYHQKPSVNPIEAGVGNLLDKLHITNHLKNHVANVRAKNAKKYQDQNSAAAGAYAAGTLPYSMTPEGQAETKKAADEQALEAQRAAAELAVANARAQAERDVANARQITKPPKGMKAMEQGGVAFGVMDQDTGKQYLPSQLGPNGDAPPEAKQIWETIQRAQQVKADEQAKRDAERDKRLANTLGNMGTWTIAEDGHGNTTLYNSKTGQTREAPAGLHKSGYYAKQIAPLEAAGLNISSYIDGRVYDGPGDLALQHEFFTATQPATGFRMTKVQQDILQNSQNWLNSLQAKAYHFAHGTWFSDEQRRQIAKAAQDAIDAKKKVLMQSSGGPKTDEIRKKAQSGKSLVDRLNDALTP